MWPGLEPSFNWQTDTGRLWPVAEAREGGSSGAMSQWIKNINGIVFNNVIYLHVPVLFLFLWTLNRLLSLSGSCLVIKYWSMKIKSSCLTLGFNEGWVRQWGNTEYFLKLSPMQILLSTTILIECSPLKVSVRVSGEDLESPPSWYRPQQTLTPTHILISFTLRNEADESGQRRREETRHCLLESHFWIHSLHNTSLYLNK